MTAIHERARNLGLCAVIAADRTRVCNHPVHHVGVHSQTDNGWNLCECRHAVVEHKVARAACCLCDCPRFVTPSRTDRQPPASASDAKGGETPVAPAETKQPDLVTCHEETPSAD